MEKHSGYAAAQTDEYTKQKKALAVIQPTLNPIRYDSSTWHDSWKFEIAQFPQ